jgi:hypothetical protein
MKCAERVGFIMIAVRDVLKEIKNTRGFRLKEW